MTTQQVPLSTRLVLSATSGCVASTFCHPLDVLRVQLQTDTTTVGVSGRATQSNTSAVPVTTTSPLQAARKIIRKGGVTALWDGLSAAYLRQFTYSMVRIGLFSYLLDGVKRQTSDKSESRGGKGTDVSFSTKVLLGSIAGTVGSVFGNPAEIAIVRMCNDSKLPPTQQRHYQSSIHAVIRIAQEEGAAGLFRGVVNSSARAAVLNGCLLGTYSQAKEALVDWEPSIFTTTTSVPTMFVGSLFSTFWGVGASMPLDVVKSRYEFEFK